MEEYFEIGKIVNTHGVKGEIKVLPLTDDPKRFEKLKWAYVDKAGMLEKLNIESVKYFKSFVILKFKEIQSMDDAEKLREMYIKVDRANAVKLPRDSYFISDLIGCSVYEDSGKLLGELKDVLKTGSNDVYIVRDDKGGECLVPALKSVVKDISVKDKRITVTLPEGLKDDEI